VTNVVFVCQRMHSPATHGLGVRIVNVARQLKQRGFGCHAVIDTRDRVAVEQVFSVGGFDSLHSLETGEPTNPLRYFRLSDEHYGRRSNPEAFRRAVADLHAICRSVSADVVISASTGVAEFVRTIPDVVKIADVCDSPTLAIRRSLAADQQLSQREAWLMRLELQRQIRLERSICRNFDRIVAISKADSQTLAEAADDRDRNKVVTISNGVSGQFLSVPAPEIRSARAVAFWGNLDYPPNATAIFHFFERVFVPFLESKSVGWCILGPGASDRMLSLLGRHPAIELGGFVPDLAASLSDIPVMVNPMVMGAGQKNKILEAFALGLAVVSTSLGMNGIEAVAGEHYLEADDPASFAEAVLSLLSNPDQLRALSKVARELVSRKYSWDCAGDHWHRVIVDTTKMRPRAA